MSNLSVHIIFGKEIHLEGDDVAVRELLQKYGPTTSDIAANTEKFEFSLLQVVTQSLAQSEPEWLLVYAGSFPQLQFTRYDMLSAYKSTQRYSSNRSKNLSFNLKTCIKQGWFNVLNPNTYSLSPKGKIHLEEILSRLKH